MRCVCDPPSGLVLGTPDFPKDLADSGTTPQQIDYLAVLAPSLLAMALALVERVVPCPIVVWLPLARATVPTVAALAISALALVSYRHSFPLIVLGVLRCRARDHAFSRAHGIR
jgi:hypothetical protein